ncbi:MAG: peptidase M48 Ste24p [Deltaproteobacteria bacterium]|nr:MAG: peptidase M48 Ste24p [Deltaproteobacteria bacterium]
MKKLFLLYIVLLCTACAQSPTGRSQLMLVSPEMAIKSSRSAYIETLKPLREKGRVDNDRALTGRVQKITGRLIAQAIALYPHTKDWGWDVTVIDDPEIVNAWCMAGGKMAIYSGLIEKLKASDDEIAQVMGHEISHALANHTAERMSIALASQLGLAGVSIAAGDSDYRGALLTGSAAAAMVAINLPNSRTAEAEADEMGIDLAARAGYDPRAAVSLWTKMAELGGKKPPEFLSTHPSSAHRKQTLTILAEKVMPYYLDRSSRPVYRFR